MSEFKKEILELIYKYYPDYEYVEIKVMKPMATFPPKIEVRVME
ncbi:MAG: hypothetical protein WC455_31265 [Dehalococcoidia bacterium]|jgi:dihydroneopterin aldolase